MLNLCYTFKIYDKKLLNFVGDGQVLKRILFTRLITTNNKSNRDLTKYINVVQVEKCEEIKKVNFNDVELFHLASLLRMRWPSPSHNSTAHYTVVLLLVYKFDRISSFFHEQLTFFTKPENFKTSSSCSHKHRCILCDFQLFTQFIDRIHTLFSTFSKRLQEISHLKLKKLVNKYYMLFIEESVTSSNSRSLDQILSKVFYKTKLDKFHEKSVFAPSSLTYFTVITTLLPHSEHRQRLLLLLDAINPEGSLLIS
jgi:hypothetical protein